MLIIDQGQSRCCRVSCSTTSRCALLIRITANRLPLYIPTLEKETRHLVGSDRGDLLNQFCEAVKAGGREIEGMTYRTDEHRSLKMLEGIMGCVPLMNPEKSVMASQLVAGTGDYVHYRCRMDRQHLSQVNICPLLHTPS